MSVRTDRLVLSTLQGLVLGLPLFLGGRQSAAVTVAALVVVALLVVTLRERRRREAPHAPGVTALAAFTALGLATTVPLPPAVLSVLAPAASRLYAATLPGWPGGGGWSVWRSLAIDPYAVWTELRRFSIGFGAFAVLVAYPWDESARGHAFARLVLTLVAGGAVLAGIALCEQVAGNGNVFWVTDAPAISGRASGPFVNPNHFAAWLEMIMPVGVGYALGLARRTRRHVVRSAQSGRGMGVSARRAWVAALVVHQQRLWAPLVAASAVLLMLVAHLATGSRGGTAALLVGLGVATAGMLLRADAKKRSRTRRWAPLAVTGALVLASVVTVAAWGLRDVAQPTGADVDAVDVSLGSRLAVGAAGQAIVRDFPLFGSGLGSWLHAFRPHVAPPIEGGIWDHAHDDYLELAAETGIAGCLLAALFALAVVRSARRRGLVAQTRVDLPPDFRPPDWHASAREVTLLRWGLAGGVTAILLHSVVEFGLRMPANLLLAMVVLGLLVLSGRPQPARSAPALALLLPLLALALVPGLVDSALVVAGAVPLSPAECLTVADVAVAEQGDDARSEALALVHRALDRSPANSEAHKALADVLGPGAEGDEALRRALALDPWSAEMRDDLAFRLLDRGATSAGLAELEESIYRFPYLASHAFLGPDVQPKPGDRARLIRALAEGDTLGMRLATLEPDVADAVERGLTRALDDAGPGDERATIVNDRVTLLEARERWQAAARVLSDEAKRTFDGDGNLPRAARNYLKAGEAEGAEQSLLVAVLRSPEEGDLYHDLAVDVYAARGDFKTADSVLAAGERNALDLLPIYNGMTEVLEKRESTRTEDFVGPLPQSALDGETP